LGVKVSVNSVTETNMMTEKNNSGELTDKYPIQSESIPFREGVFLLAEQAPPAGAPPRYEHPPPYGPVGWTPDRGAVVNVGVQRVPPDSTVAAARRRYMLSRSPGGATSSSSCHIALACIVFWLCGCLFGAIAFLLAGLFTVTLTCMKPVVNRNPASYTIV